MKRFATVACLLAFSLLCLGITAGPTAFGEERKFEDLAQRVVRTSANVKPGDVVVISGGRHTIALMEALAVEAEKAGGMVQMFLSTDRLLRARFAEKDEKYLDQKPAFVAEWMKHINVWISLPGAGDPKAVFADVPQARFAKADKAGRVIDDMINDAGVREVVIGYPTQEIAAINQLDFAAYEKMHWEAVNANYEQIAQMGKRLKEMLETAKTVKVTSPSGTNLTFSLGGRPVFVNDGIVTEAEAKAKLFFTRFASLPGGLVSVTPIETSANGRVVVPRGRCRFRPMTGASFELRNGKLQNFRAEKGGDCFEETLAPYTGPKDMFAWLEIGLNPALRVVEDPGDYRPRFAAGMVWLWIGGNDLGEGSNKTEFEFVFPIVKATVEIDGKVVVKEGQLTL